MKQLVLFWRSPSRPSEDEEEDEVGEGAGAIDEGPIGGESWDMNRLQLDIDSRGGLSRS